jgi:hypothetical protein
MKTQNSVESKGFKTIEALKPANKCAKRPKEAKIMLWKRATFGYKNSHESTV